MYSVVKVIGSIIFWLSWPIFFFYFRNTHRTRVILVSGNKVLFIKNLIYRNQLSFPGGGLHKNESVINSATREIKEETGIEVDPKQLHLLTSNKLVSDVGIKYTMSSYYVELPKKIKAKPQVGEVLTAEWLDWKDLVDTYHISKLTNDILHTWIKNKDLLD